MRTLHSLTRRLEKLEAATRARYAAPDCAIILYNPNKHDEDWKQAEIARRIEQGAGYIKTIFLMPEKETLEENAARYAAYRERNL